jgi:MFS superfamily sulfate permease-like transporter
MKHIREAMGTSFMIALLGFFESSVAAKSLGGEERKDGIQGIQLSANRELVALGVANIVGSCFRALPAFGGYGRSKVNASTGGKTPMSSVFLSLITIICVVFLLPAFHYLPVSSSHTPCLLLLTAGKESRPLLHDHSRSLVLD